MTSLVETALELYGLRSARVVPLRSGFQQVFRVDSLGSGSFVLRLYNLPPAVERVERSDLRSRFGARLRSPETLRSQLLWLSALARETGLAVPEPVRTPDGSLVARVSLQESHPRRALLRRAWRHYLGAHRPEHAERHCVLLRWVPGEQRRPNPTPADASSIGSFIARLHEHVESYVVPDPPTLPRWDWHWPFGPSAPLWERGAGFFSAGEMNVFEEAARRVREDLDALGCGREAFGIIHRDLKLENLLFREAGAVGAIDFDMSGLGHYLLDLAVVTGVIHLLGPKASRGTRHSPGALRGALLEGYASERRLPDDHYRYLAAFGAMRRVNSVNRELGRPAAGTVPLGGAPRGGERLLRDSVAWLERNYLEHRGPGDTP